MLTALKGGPLEKFSLKKTYVGFYKYTFLCLPPDCSTSSERQNGLLDIVQERELGGVWVVLPVLSHCATFEMLLHVLVFHFHVYLNCAQLGQDKVLNSLYSILHKGFMSSEGPVGTTATQIIARELGVAALLNITYGKLQSALILRKDSEGFMV